MYSIVINKLILTKQDDVCLFSKFKIEIKYKILKIK